jgi:hypothetical protein
MNDRHGGGNTAIILSIAALVIAALIVGVIILHQRRPAVLLLGDSITQGASPVLRGKLGDDYAVHVDGRGGFRVDEMMEAADNASRFPFEQVVINLGTNDVLGSDQDLDASLASLRAMTTRFPEAECIHIVTVSEHMASMTADSPARAAEFNEGVFALAEDDDRIRVIDWSEIVGDYEREHPDADVTNDTVHPTALGNELLVAAYRDALADC